MRGKKKNSVNCDLPNLERDKLPKIEVEWEDMTRIYFPTLYSAFYRIYVAAHTGFFTMMLAFLVYLYFIVNYRENPISFSFLGVNFMSIILFLVSIILTFLNCYFFLRHKAFSAFLLKFEEHVELKNAKLKEEKEKQYSLRDLYLDDLYPKNLLIRFYSWFTETGISKKGRKRLLLL